MSSENVIISFDDENVDSKSVVDMTECKFDFLIQNCVHECFAIDVVSCC